MEFETAAIRERIAKDLNMSAESADIYDSMVKFASRNLEPKREKSDIYPLVPFLEDQLRALAGQGLFGLVVSAERGGAGMTLSDLNAALTALSQYDASFAAILLTQSIATDLIAAEPAPPSGDAVLGEMIGGALAAYPLFHDARDEWQGLCYENGRLQGEIRNLTLAPVAQTLIVPALEKGTYSLFRVNARAGSVKVGAPNLMHGLRQCPHADVIFSGAGGADVVRIGGEGCAHEILVRMRNRFAGSALAVIGGVGLGATAYTAGYMHTRYQTGSQLIDKTPLKVMLANLKIASWEAIYAANRLAAFAAAGRAEDDLMLPALIDFKDRVADLMPDAVQLMGGYAYMRDYPQEQRYRDARQLQAIFGRSEFLKSDLIVSAMAV